MGTKILMVGLGGTGCRAVARIMDRVLLRRAETKDGTLFSDVQFVGFDSNRNGQAAYGTLPMVWTTRGADVSELVAGLDGCEEWFPTEIAYRMRGVYHSAPTTRMLSRLLLEDTLKRENSDDDPMAALHSAIDQLMKPDGGPRPTQIVVVIISSFAGGTGSGIFIQIALYLRRLLMNRLYINDVTTCGLFALPDIYAGLMHSGEEKRAAYANAYASMKELCAINRLIPGDDPLAERIRMRYGDLFDSRTDRYGDGRLLKSKIPYDSVLFVDNVNTNGMMLTSLEAYESMIADIGFMKICSPTASLIPLHQDDRIRMWNLIGGIYASAGCSRIVYPHDDIVEYCVRRMMADNLDSEWLYFDNLYRKQLEEAKIRRKTDHSVLLPKRAESYVSAVDRCLADGTAQFAFLKDDLRSEPDRYFSILLDAIREQVDAGRAKNEAIRVIAGELENDGNDVDRARTRTDIVDAIIKREYGLENYYRTVQNQLPAIRNVFLSGMLPDSADTPDKTEPYSLHQLFRSPDGRALHPLSVRYVLYSLQLRMKQKCHEAAGKNSVLKKRIEAYLSDSHDWKPATKETDSASDAVPILAWNRRGYVSRYIGESGKCLSDITEFAVCCLTCKILDGCLEMIADLICHYEMFFDCLTDYLEEQKRQAEQLETKHDSRIGTVIYVQASPQAKRRAYYRAAEFRRDDMAGLNDRILTEMYTSYIWNLDWMQMKISEDSSERRTIVNRHRKNLESLVRRVFEECAADAFRQMILSDPSDAVNISIVRAIEKECADLMLVRNYQSEDEPRRELLEGALARSIPFLMYDRNTAGGDSKTFWGISDKAAAEMGGDFRAYFGGSETVLPSPRYSEYEISCYQAVRRLKAADIMKFRDTDPRGIFSWYYNALRRTDRDDDVRGLALMVHTDKRWLEGLPDIG